MIDTKFECRNAPLALLNKALESGKKVMATIYKWEERLEEGDEKSIDSVRDQLINLVSISQKHDLRNILEALKIHHDLNHQKVLDELTRRKAIGDG